MTQWIACADGAHRDRAVAAALAAVRRGDVVVLPTEHVYAVATDAFSARGIARLREAKAYESAAPIPVMVASRTTVPGIATHVTPAVTALMEAFWPGLLTVLLRPQPSLAWSLPADSPVGVRVPAHPIALALLARSGPLAVTTANLPGVPAPLDVDDALAQLGDHVALALDGGPLDPRALGAAPSDRPTVSTVVDATGQAPVIVREGAVSAAEIARVTGAVEL